MTDLVVPTPPKFNEIVTISKAGWDGVPDSPNPFYVLAEDGLFVHRHGLLGRGMAKVPHIPSFLPKFGYEGAFNFLADPVPARLMGQVVNFFERIYDRQSTEAAVLLIMHQETREWRIFVPTQLVSHGGVNYVFEPTHIRLPWIIVGSIHSHCDFGAGHSSTDTGDADGFDGLHMTIGHIKRPVPEIVAMVAQNKRLVHYHSELFPKLFDFSEVKQHEAPAWWDRYVENTKTKTKPIGFDLYEKYKKPTAIKAEKLYSSSPGYKSPGVQPFRSSDWVYSESEKKMVRVASDTEQPVEQKYAEFYEKLGEKIPERFATIDPNTLIKHGFVYDFTLHTWLYDQTRDKTANATEKKTTTTTRPMTSEQLLTESRLFNRGRSHDDVSRADDEDDQALLDEIYERYGMSASEDMNWEDFAPHDLIDILNFSITWTDDDSDWSVRNPRLASSYDGWRRRYIEKLVDVQKVLATCGIDVRFTLNEISGSEAISNQLALLPGEIRTDSEKGQEASNGVH